MTPTMPTIITTNSIPWWWKRAVEREQLIGALQQLVAAHTIYRIKGFAALPGKAMRLVLHGVGQRFDSYFDRARGAPPSRRARAWC